MVFFLNLVFSTLYATGFNYLTYSRGITKSAFIGYFMPMLLLWIYICGGQYYVGTDYPSYIELFNGIGIEQYYKYGEFGFWWIVVQLNNLGIKGQNIYFIFYGIGLTFLLYIIRDSKIEKPWIFILLYIAYTSLFNNQLNGLRQTVSTYIGVYGVLCFLQNRSVKGILLILVAISIHLTGCILLLCLLRSRIDCFNKKWLKIILIGSLLVAFSLSPTFMDNLTDYLPIKYASLINSGAIETNDRINIISKLLFWPFFYMAVCTVQLDKLSRMHRTLFRLGIIGFSIRIALVGVSLVGRISIDFLIFSIYPLYYLIYYLKKHKIEYYSSLVILFTYYFAKVVLFPRGEYDYAHYIFRQL